MELLSVSPSFWVSFLVLLLLVLSKLLLLASPGPAVQFPSFSCNRFLNFALLTLVFFEFPTCSK